MNVPCNQLPFSIYWSTAVSVVLVTMSATPAAVAQQIPTDGEGLYGLACANCHGLDGAGVEPGNVAFTVPTPDFTDCSFSSREPDADWIAVAHQGGPVRAFDETMYRPRLVVLRTGQPLLVRNSDATLHNVHVYATNNRGFNIGQPFQGIESQGNFQAPEVGIQVKCDVHGWMSGSIAVFDHGFFGLTDDNGNFSVEDLPPGDYVFEAWHPVLGTKTQSVTITGGDIPLLQFEFTS